jgi:uncharacterized protein YecE (DUF72 family)
MFYSGTSNVAVPEANRTLYPQAYRDKSKLHYYASLFNTVEINTTFKKLPMRRTIEKWAERVGEDFRFTFKLNSAITHNKSLLFHPDDLIGFIDLINLVGDKKACLLIQFPGKLTAACAPQLESLLNIIRKTDPLYSWKTAIEFRNPGWYHQDVFDLLRAHNSALVFHDMPGSSSPLNEITAAFVYLRLHGTEKGYRGSYPEGQLASYAAQIKAWMKQGKIVYTYFNNTLGDAVNNLLSLNKLILLN